jgi:CHAD domain-containing protein
MRVEVELKLLADDGFSSVALLEALCAGGATVSAPTTVRVHDVYLDTRSRSLARAGLSGRWRRKDGRGSLDVKPELLLPGLVLGRVEISTRLARGEDPGRALRALVERVLPLTLRGLPVPEVEVRSVREVYRVELPSGPAAAGSCEAELCIARAVASGPGVRTGVPFSEVELELLEGEVEPLLAVAERLATFPGLTPSKQSKHRRALELLDLPVFRPAPPSPTFGPLTPTDLAARHLCGTQLAAVRAFEQGSRAGLDPEYVHKMRVATRRLRAGLRVFAPCFDRRTLERLSGGLGWLADALGEVRDLDVQLLQLPERRRRLGPDPQGGWEELRAVLAARRDEARTRLLRVLGSRRYSGLLERSSTAFSLALPRRRSGHPGAARVVETAAAILERRVKQFVNAASDCRHSPTPGALHALRIRGKKLRYASEFFRPLFGDGFASGVARFADFQDTLGRFQDEVVLGELASTLRDAVLRGGGSSEYLYVLGQLAAASRLGSETGERELSQAFEGLGGAKAVRSLAKEARQRAAAVRSVVTAPGDASATHGSGREI